MVWSVYNKGLIVILLSWKVNVEISDNNSSSNSVVVDDDESWYLWVYYRFLGK